MMPVTAQITDSTNNYFYIVEQQDAYYDSLILENGADSMEGTGFKQYQRWKNFVGPRVDEDGGLSSYIEAVNSYYLATNPVASGYDWNYFGPKGLFEETTIYGAGKGWVNRILVDDGHPGKIWAGTHNSGLWRTTDGGLNWYIKTAQVPEITGIATMFQTNDGTNRIYLATVANITTYSNGIFRSIDEDGNAWEKIDVDLGSGSIYPTANKSKIPRKLLEHPNESNTLFLLTNHFLYKTTDGGDNWIEVLEDDYNQQGTEEGKLNFWGGERFNDLIFDNHDPEIMYLAGHIVLKSTDGGDSWQNDITQEVAGEDKIDFCKMYNDPNLDANDPLIGDVWFISGKLQGDGLVISKFDYSSDEPYVVLKSWTSNFIGANAHKVAFFVDPQNENRIFVGGLQIRVLNKDQTTGVWVESYISRGSTPYPPIDDYVHDDIRDLYFYRSGGQYPISKLIVACDGGVATGKMQTIEDNLEDWIFWDLSVYGNNRETDLNINEVYSLGTNNQNSDMLFNCQDVGGYKIKTNSVLERVHNGDGGSVKYDYYDPSYYSWHDYQFPGRFFVTYNDKNKWAVAFGPGESTPFLPIEKPRNNPNVLFTGKPHLYKYTDAYNSKIRDSTTTLQNIEEFFCEVAGKQKYFKFNNYLTDIEISENDPNIMFVSTERSYFDWSRDFGCNVPPLVDNYRKALFKSTDGGNTWADLSPFLLGLKAGNITDIIINPKEDNTIWLCFGKASNGDNFQEGRKVYKSTDGGLSFTAFAQGIPPAIPVWDMEYDERTDLLYVATDLGVFSRPADGSSEWANISTQGSTHPITMVYDIEINYRDRMLYAGTFGRGIWAASLGDCPSFSNIAVRISEDTEWNTPHSINSDLIVEAGVTLTITDVVYFHSESKLIVERGEANGSEEGGKLIIDHGILTNSCDGATWKGVEVWGHSSLVQHPLYQGTVITKNDGVISNAKIAILADSREAPEGVGTYFGGIVIARKSKFINNITGVKLHSKVSQKMTISSFKQCSFVTDYNWPHTAKNPIAFVDLYNYGDERIGISIEGCSFINYVPEKFYDDERGIGILSMSTMFFVDDAEICTSNIQPCPETYFVQSYFEGLTVGVNASVDEEMLPCTITNSEFVDNLNGINLFSVYNAEITLNDFKVPLKMDAHGLYLRECYEGYHVEANVFYGEELSAYKNYGLIVHNSGEHINLIYNNSFSNLYYASSFQEVNRITGSYNGLVVKCNTYTSNIYDIFVKGNRGIAFDQGSSNPQYTDELAGNIFSDGSVHPDHMDIQNESMVFYYNHHNQENSSLKLEPLQFTSLTVMPREFHNIDFNPDQENGSCPSTLDNGGSGSGTRGEMLAAASSADSTSNVIVDLKDGGDTESLNFDTETAMPGEAIETRDMLIAESPNLSDSVMIAAIENEETLPNAMVRDVLVENPQAAKSDEVQAALDNRANEMSAFMRDEIDEGRDTLSEIEVKRSHLSAFRLKEQLAYNRLQNIYRSDTNITAFNDSLMVLYDLKGGISNKYRKAMLYLSVQDTVSADSVIDNVYSNYELTLEQENERQSFVDYFTVKKRIIAEGFIYPDSIAIESFNEIYNTGTGSPVVLSALQLDWAGEISIPLPHYQADTATFKNGRIMDSPGIGDKGHTKNNWLILKPNPAGDYFIAEYRLPDNMSEGSIIITSIDGVSKKVLSINRKTDEVVITTIGLKPGVYIVSLFSGDAIVESKKLSIVK